MDIVARLLNRSEPHPANHRPALEALFTGSRGAAPQSDILGAFGPARFLGALLSGFAIRYKTLARGRRQIIGFVLPGDIFDLHSLATGATDHAIAAAAPSRFAVAARGDVLQALETNPALRAALERRAATEGAIFREGLASLGQRTAAERIAHLFCELDARLGAAGLAAGHSFRLPLTQGDLADAAGLSLVHVNRVLQQLRGQGLLEFHRGWARLPDADALARLAGFTPDYLGPLAPQETGEADQDAAPVLQTLRV